MNVLRIFQVLVFGAAIALSGVVPAAAPIHVFDSFHFVDNSQSSAFGAGGRRLSFGADLTPTPFQGARIRVTARQNGIARNVPFLFSPALPNQFFRSITFDPALMGAWTLTIEDLDDPTNVAVVTTNSICPLLCQPPFGAADPFQTPFIRNVATSDLSTQPRFTWTQPSFIPPAGTLRRTNVFVHARSDSDRIVHVRSLSATQEFLQIPPVMNGGVPMVAGHQYLVSVETTLSTLGGPEIETARSYFNFSPSFNPIVFPGPVALPRTDFNGVFTFDLDVTSGTPVLLDPAAAVGYDFAVGEGNPFFASVKLPNLGDFNYTIDLWNGTAWAPLAVVPPGVRYDFAAPGVERFRVRGIDPALAVNPADAVAFVTEVTFAGDGRFTGTMTPIVAVVTVDVTPPVTTASRSGAPNAAGWDRNDVTVTLAAVDEVGGSGVKSISRASSGAQIGASTTSGALATVTIVEDGGTAVHYFATDFAGNVEAEKTIMVFVDKTPPVISGMPDACALWPPNGKLVRVATVTASDAASGIASLEIGASSSEPAAARDIVVNAAAGGAREVWLRAARAGDGPGRTYTITATARDVAGNASEAHATCTVPHDQGG